MIIGGEDEAVAGLRPRIPVVDGIGQPAGGAHDRDGPVAETDQLTEAAWLESRRHQEHVGAGVNMLGEHRLEPDRGRHLLRVVARVGAEQLLIASIPGTEHDKLQVQPHQPPHDVGDQVEPLLVVQP